MTDATSTPDDDKLKTISDTLKRVEQALLEEGCPRDLIARAINRVVYGHPEGADFILRPGDDILRLDPVALPRVEELQQGAAPWPMLSNPGLPDATP